MFTRSYYNKLLKEAEKENKVIVVKGVRGAGKTSFLSSYLKGNENNLIFIDFDSCENQHLREKDALKEYLKETLILTSSSVENKTVILISEIQSVANGIEQLKFVQRTSYCQIYATSSRGICSDSDCTVINMYPMSFREYMEFNGYDVCDRERYLIDYMGRTSFIAPCMCDSFELQKTLLEGLKNSIYLNDIILTGAIKNNDAFSRVLRYLMENIGFHISAYNISRELTSSGFKIASDTVDGYLELLCDCNMVSYCERFDVKKKELLKTNGIYYTGDLGLRELFIGSKRNSSPMLNLLKNIVYYELCRLSDRVNTGWNPEVDFIACKDNGVSYYMVDVTLDDKSVLQKQLNTLSSIRDNYPKYILSLDTEDYSSNGIIHKNLTDFLLGK